MTFSGKDLSHAYCMPGAAHLPQADSNNVEVIWVPDYSLTTTPMSL